MKVAVIGGGSSYTPELVKGFLDRVATFPLTELWLVDIDPQRLDGGGRLCPAYGRGQGIALPGASDHRPPRGRGRGQLRHHATARRRHGGAAQRRVPGQAPRPDRPGDHRRGRHGQGAAHHPGGAGHRRGHGRAGARRAAGQLHQPGRPGHRGAGPLRARHAGHRRVQRADHRQDGHSRPLAAAHGRDHRAGAGRAEDAGPEPPLLAPRLHRGRRGRLAAGDRGHAGRAARERASRLGPGADRNAPDAAQLLPVNYFYSTAKKLAEQEQWPPSRAETVMQVEADLLAEYADPNRTSRRPT